jgi:prepilin-type N-terminal cleavage/methylation domain-containing protein
MKNQACIKEAGGELVSRSQGAFTVIELVVVLAIIGILTAVLLRTLAVPQQTEAMSSLSNVRPRTVEINGAFAGNSNCYSNFSVTNTVGTASNRFSTSHVP